LKDPDGSVSAAPFGHFWHRGSGRREHGLRTGIGSWDGLTEQKRDVVRTTAAAKMAPADVTPDLWCDGGPAVTECVRYCALLSSCLHNDADAVGACQDSLIAKADADISMIQQLCVANLQRLQTACR
jgi:hypothetical protein